MITMRHIARFLDQAKLALHRWERVENIPTDKFNAIMSEHLSNGWRKTYEYAGFDAWIDYGRVDLRQGAQRLRFEWTNYFEGTISGAPPLIRAIAEKYELEGLPSS